MYRGEFIGNIIRIAYENYANKYQSVNKSNSQAKKGLEIDFIVYMNHYVIPVIEAYVKKLGGF